MGIGQIFNCDSLHRYDTTRQDSYISVLNLLRYCKARGLFTTLNLIDSFLCFEYEPAGPLFVICKTKYDP